MSENRTVAACYSIASTYILLETTKIKPCYAHLVLWEFKIFGKKIQTSASGSSNDHSHQICHATQIECTTNDTPRLTSATLKSPKSARTADLTTNEHRSKSSLPLPYCLETSESRRRRAQMQADPPRLYGLVLLADAHQRVPFRHLRSTDQATRAAAQTLRAREG